MSKKASNKQIAKAFRDAVPHLHVNDGYEYDMSLYICHAIALGSSGGTCRVRITTAGAVAARDIIKERMGTVNGLGMWLREKHGIIPASVEALQTYRHAWLQLLIKEFESK